MIFSDRLYKFDIKSEKSIELFSYLGIDLSINNGTYIISDLQFSSKARKIGIEPDDQLTLIEFNNSTHLSKNWGYVIGLILLSMILIIQLRTSKFNIGYVPQYGGYFYDFCLFV